MISKSSALIFVSAVVALSAGFWFSSTMNESGTTFESSNEAEIAAAKAKFSPIQGTLLSPARKIAVPALIKDNATAFTQDDITGHWSLLFFGYTHCPDICPTTMGVTALAKKVAEANNHMFPQVIFVSVDPARDKVDMLTDYVQYFDKDFIGVTGDEDLIKALTLQMSVVYMKMAPETDAASGYLVDHSSALLLLNPEGKLRAFLNPPHEPATITKDIQTVINLSN